MPRARPPKLMELHAAHYYPKRSMMLRGCGPEAYAHKEQMDEKNAEAKGRRAL